LKVGAVCKVLFWWVRKVIFALGCRFVGLESREVVWFFCRKSAYFMLKILLLAFVF
jgi:hypothetical protein